MQHTSITNKFNKFVKLSTWWQPQINDTHIRESRWFESMYTLQGKTWSTRHTLSTVDSRMVLDHTSPVIRVGNLSLVPTRMKQATTPGRILGDQRQIDSTVVSGHLILPPSLQPWSRGEMFRSSGYTVISTYWVHKHQHAIGTFNTFSRGPTYRSLIDIGGGYSIEDADFTHSTPWPSQPTVLPFPPMGPARSPVYPRI
jgi:hypothetical protein